MNSIPFSQLLAAKYCSTDKDEQNAHCPRGLSNSSREEKTRTSWVTFLSSGSNQILTLLECSQWLLAFHRTTSRIPHWIKILCDLIPIFSGEATIFPILPQCDLKCAQTWNTGWLWIMKKCFKKISIKFNAIINGTEWVQWEYQRQNHYIWFGTGVG